jgi:hypothetical protein
VTYNCRRGIPWNSGLELCAAQVEDCSFFFIEENINIDPELLERKIVQQSFLSLKGVLLENTLIKSS